MDLSHRPLPIDFECPPVVDKTHSPASPSVAISQQTLNTVDRKHPEPGTAMTNTRLQFGLAIGSQITSGTQSVQHREIRYLGLGTVHAGKILSTNRCHGSYTAAIRWSSSLPEASVVTKIRSIAMQGQKFGTTDIRLAHSENPDLFRSEILVPIRELVIRFMIKNGIRAGKMPMGFVSAYHASISELRQLMEEDRNRARAVWSVEERQTFLALLNSIDEVTLKQMRFLRKLRYALLLPILYFFLPSNMGTLRSESHEFEDQSSNQHHSRRHIGNLDKEDGG